MSKAKKKKAARKAPKKKATAAKRRGAKASPPFEFVIEALDGVVTGHKHMFGAFALYVEDRIVMILRDKEDHRDDNGIWLATAPEHHASLKEELTTMSTLRLFGPGPTSWQNLPSEEPAFEESALRACELVSLGDPRIGKVPKSKISRKRK